MTKYTIDDIKLAIKNRSILLSYGNFYCIPLYIEDDEKIRGNWVDNIKNVYKEIKDPGWNKITDIKKIIPNPNTIDGLFYILGYN